MSTRVLVPLYRLEVNYLVRHGRRWSALEHLILWACREPASAQDLASRAGVPVRLVSECLVNLLRAGWLELRASATANVFVATEAGARAAAKPLPDQFLETQPRSTQLYMDRLCGEFFTHTELTIMRRSTPGFRPEEGLEPNLFQAFPIGPELVDRLPLRKDDTFERLRESPQPVPGDLFAVVEADESGFTGLPARTPAAVGLAIADSLRAKRVDAAPGGTVPSDEAVLGSPLQQRRSWAPIRFGPDTLVVGGREHLAAAREVIGKARRLVVIHSTFVGRNIKNLLPSLAEAAASGVQIHVHWGRTDDPEGIEANPSEMAARLARTEIPPEHRANVHLGLGSTGSHAKVILADTGDDDGYCAIVGSCNWLDSPYESVEASVRLTDPAAVAHVAGRMASVLAPAVGHDLVVSRLLDVHGECAARPKDRQASHEAMLIVDQDHYAAVRDAMHEAGNGGTVLLGSHKFGHAAETTVLHPMRAAARLGARVKLFYTTVLPNLGIAAAAVKQAELAVDEVELRRAGERMHAKFIGWGERLLITSFNFLSASVNGRHRGGAEIGVLLTGPGIVEEFEAKLAAHNVLSEYRESGGRPGKRRRRRRPSRARHA